MEETLIIKNFGPIESVELKLKRFTILIGEQATGKSTVAKVLAVFRYFSYIIGNVNYLEEAFESGLNAWGLSEAIHVASFIYYECADYSVKVENIIEVNFEDNGPDEPPLKIERSYFRPIIKPKAEEFIQLIDEFNKLKPQFNNGYRLVKLGWKIPTSFFQNDVSRVMDNPFYLPTERGLQSIFSLGKSSIQNLSDSLFNQFAKLDQIARFFKDDTLIEPLNIEYKNESGKGFVRKKGTEQYFSLYNGASGYQSTIPVVLLFEYYSLIRKKKKTFLIEEPELNLFPIAQNELMKYLVDRSTTYNHQLLLTTHSPYILTSLNNLLYAYKVGQDHEEEVNKIINKKYWVNPDDVAAYRLTPGNSQQDIFDSDLNIIDAGEIDGVSESINSDWDKISNIRFARVDAD